MIEWSPDSVALSEQILRTHANDLYVECEKIAIEREANRVSPQFVAQGAVRLKLEKVETAPAVRKRPWPSLLLAIGPSLASSAITLWVSFEIQNNDLSELARLFIAVAAIVGSLLTGAAVVMQFSNDDDV